MQNLLPKYDVAIIGGGLAGLATAILLARRKKSVILFEKEKYPFHKVCGEYISLESRPFLQSLGLEMEKMHLPFIDKLFLTAPNGKSFTTHLPLGGFGISRFTLDNQLKNIAIENGVHVLDETKVDDIRFDNEYAVAFTPKHSGCKETKSKICCGAFGKRSNLDVKWKRPFIEDQKKSENYVGVKYHLKANWPSNVIGLHNFKNGYCGISKIEEDKYCVCYMTTAENLKACNNNIRKMEETILYKNPHLKSIFTNSEVVDAFPITISQINFQRKTLIENGILMLGDAAGMITPLCGNGMSIALHTGKMAATLLDQHLNGSITKSEMESQYIKLWDSNFKSRMKTGRVIQHFFGSNSFTNLFVSSFKIFPFLAKPLIKLTHGKPF